jgi:hypothetical protein
VPPKQKKRNDNAVWNFEASDVSYIDKRFNEKIGRNYEFKEVT